MQRHSDEECLGWRASPPTGRPKRVPVDDLRAAARRRAACSSGYVARGLKPGDHVGMYSVNTAEWCVLDSAMTRNAMVSVPLYDTLGPDAVRFICNHAELAAVCVSHACLPVMLRCLADCPTVKLLVVYAHGGKTLPPMRPRRRHRCKVVTIEQLVAEGGGGPLRRFRRGRRRWRQSATPPGPPATRRGVMLTHRNLISNAAAYADDLDLGPGDVHVSYLPLAHIYERVTMLVCLFAEPRPGSSAATCSACWTISRS